jgi:hypothetical protein
LFTTQELGYVPQVHDSPSDLDIDIDFDEPSDEDDIEEEFFVYVYVEGPAFATSYEPDENILEAIAEGKLKVLRIDPDGLICEVDKNGLVMPIKEGIVDQLEVTFFKIVDQEVSDESS